MSSDWKIEWMSMNEKGMNEETNRDRKRSNDWEWEWGVMEFGMTDDYVDNMIGGCDMLSWW